MEPGTRQGKLLSNGQTVLESFLRHTRIDRTCEGTRPHSDFLRPGQRHGRAGRQHRDPDIAPHAAAHDRNARPPPSGKSGNLPSPLPAVERQLDFSTGTLGLWSSDHFVIYYRDGRVPQPGIILLGRAIGDVSIFDRPGPVTVRVERIK